jgi:putative ABC transport system permease protein
MHPAISALSRHKIVVVLIVLQVSLACCVTANSFFAISERIHRMLLTTGVSEVGLGWVQSSGIPQVQGAKPDKYTDIQALLGDSRVQNAAIANAVPLSGNLWSTDIYAKQGSEAATLTNVGIFEGTSGFIKTLGVNLIQGRDFNFDEYIDYSPFDDKQCPSSVIVTQALADKLWPGENPLGKPIYLGESGKYMTRVVGVVQHMLKAAISGNDGDEDNILFPVTNVPGGIYIYRTSPQDLISVSKHVPEVLSRVNSNRIILKNECYENTVRNYFRADLSLVRVLILLIVCLLIIVLLGVFSLLTYWTNNRRRQIGIRRAVGATRFDILKLFLLETAAISGVGVSIGVALAFAVNERLMLNFELPKLSILWTLAAALLVWLGSMLASMRPAYLASKVEPSVAIRAS